MSHRPTDKQQRQIEALLEVEAGGAKAGIYGREWCEACGELGSFTGFVGAMAAHPDGRRFICGRCRKGQSRAVRNRARGATLDDVILERGFRYCHGCGRETLLADRTPEEARRRPFTCPACHGLETGPAARRRYLEHEATAAGGLERAALRVNWAKAGIESMLADTQSRLTAPDTDSDNDTD